MTRSIYINLPVKDLDRAKAAYTVLGFTINPDFTDEKAACIVMSDAIRVMLLRHEFFKGFSGLEVVDSSKALEVINALDLGTRAAVDEIATKAEAAGWAKQREPDDYGWMFLRSMRDPDGHVWEFFHADDSKRPQNPA